MNTTAATLLEVYEERAQIHPEQPALVGKNGSSYTYAQVREKASDVAAMLVGRGAGYGDRIALLSENSPEWAITYLAITGMGAVVVPVLPDFSKQDARTILDHAETTAICVSSSLAHRIDGYTGTSFFLCIDDWTISEPYDAELSSLDKPNNDNQSTVKTPDPDDLAAILYTSGTTGTPKGVMLSHENIVQNVISAGELVDIGTTDRVLSILPLAHTYECTIGFLVPFTSGATIHYLGAPPSTSTLLPAMQSIRPTIMLVVPLIIEKVYQSKVRSLFEKRSFMRLIHRIGPFRKIIHRIAGKKIYEAFGGELRFFGIGGAALSPETDRFLKEARFPYSIGYGLTETAPLIAGTSAGCTRYRSTGPTIRNVEVRVSNDTDGDSSGEIQVRGPNVTRGYYKNDEATQAAFTADGWFRTGDLGSVDPDGFLYLKGRLKNVIIGPSGENIYPEDIEAAINSEAFVQESVVFEWRGELVAKVHLDIDELEKHRSTQGEKPTLESRAEELLMKIRDEVNSRLGRISRLRKMVVEWEPFEKTPTKKIRRFLYTTLDPIS